MTNKATARGKGALSAAKKAAERAAAALRTGKRHASDEESDELDPHTADRNKRKDRKKVADREEEEEVAEEEEEEAEEEDEGDIELNEDEETQTVDSTAAGHPKKRVTFNYFILPLLVVIFRFEQKHAPSVTVEIEKGQPPPRRPLVPKGGDVPGEARVRPPGDE
jgi:hypothetical protein